uniref:CCHC-type domain-containing protein n=1 Tax=Tanacetum cinerariifolium TaxID=118510 RepID=A0A699GXK9_TANCI|nr:hypothetical protein [Tanacetum cinerariifolium]
MDGVTTVLPITTAEENVQRRLEVKARSTLMMVIPNEHLLKFNSIKDAKQLFEAVEKRFEWNTHVVVWRNKEDLDTMSIDDLYNNLKVYEPEVKGMSSSNSNTRNMAFLSSTNSSTNATVNTAQAVNTANEVSTASTQVNAAFSTNIDNLNDIEEMDLRWQMAMLTMRARRFLKKTKRKLTVNGNETLGFDMSKVECYNCHKRGHFARECRALRNQDFKHKKSTRRIVHVETSTSTALIVDNYKKGLGYESYNVVPLPYTRNFLPSKPDLSFTGLDEFANKTVNENTKSNEEESKVARKNTDAPSIEEWVSDDEEENVAQPKIVKKTVKPIIPKMEFVKPRQQEETTRKTVKKVKHNRQNTHKPRGNKRN